MNQGVSDSYFIKKGNYFYVEESSENGFHSPFLIHIPNILHLDENGKARIHVMPNNTGRAVDDFEVTKASTLDTFEWATIFSKISGTILLTLIFPREESNWLVYTHALDRDTFTTDVKRLKRLDLQLKNMIELSRRMLKKGNFGVSVDTKLKVLMSGFSASGQFASRFPYIHPELVSASLFGSPGGFPMLPLREYRGKELRYPLGLSDFEEVVGKPFNESEFKKVKLIHYLGDQDDNDAVPYQDAFEDQDRVLINGEFGPTPISRWQLHNSILGDYTHNFSAHLFPGVMHEVNTNLIIEFLMSSR